MLGRKFITITENQHIRRNLKKGETIDELQLAIEFKLILKRNWHRRNLFREHTERDKTLCKIKRKSIDDSAKSKN